MVKVERLTPRQPSRIIDATLAGQVAALGRKADAALQRTKYDPGDLLIAVSNAVRLRESELSGLAGRIAGLFSRKSGDEMIELDGGKLGPLFELAQAKPPETIDFGARYNVELAGVKRLLEQARRNLG